MEVMARSCTVKTEIIENHARTLELPLLVRSVSQVMADNLLAAFSLPNPKPGILDVLASFSATSVLRVGEVDRRRMLWCVFSMEVAGYGSP